MKWRLLKKVIAMKANIHSHEVCNGYQILINPLYKILHQIIIIHVYIHLASDF